MVFHLFSFYVFFASSMLISRALDNWVCSNTTNSRWMCFFIGFLMFLAFFISVFGASLFLSFRILKIHLLSIQTMSKLKYYFLLFFSISGIIIILTIFYIAILIFQDSIEIQIIAYIISLFVMTILQTILKVLVQIDSPQQIQQTVEDQI